MFTSLPDEEKRALYVQKVRRRYLEATLDDLPTEFCNKLLSYKDDGVYLWGGTGVGKTYALAGLLKYFIALGYSVERIGYERLCQQIRDTYSSNNSEWDLLKKYITADKLVIEDLGTAVSSGRAESDFSVRTILLVLDERSEDKLPTFITGNKSPELLRRSFDERMYSRLLQGGTLRIQGEDKRAELHEKKHNK